MSTLSHGIVAGSLALYQQILQAYNHMGEGAQARIEAREVTWSRPQQDNVALNVDGSALTNPGLAGFGGLIRDHTGEFRRGFLGSVGHSDIMHAELMAIYHGISLCWELGFRKVRCYTDSLHTLKLLYKGD